VDQVRKLQEETVSKRVSRVVVALVKLHPVRVVVEPVVVVIGAVAAAQPVHLPAAEVRGT
jgi:hypothetical protein